MIFKTLLLAALPLARMAAAQKVFAHFMAQNSYSYSQADWANDINTAAGIGIDGFALNIASNDYEVGKIDLAFAAAEARGGFQFFYSFDMSYSWQQADMVSIVTRHASSSAMYKWKNAVLVSTFNGDSYGDAFWTSFKTALNAQGVTVSFAPAFISYRDPSSASSLLSAFPSIDGFFNWWSWPADVAADLTTATDVAYQNAVKSRTGPYIMSVSPWQFKELGDGQDWVEQSDQLWKYRWEQAIQLKPDIVEIVTWNDYGESHYIGDINPNVDLGDLAPHYVNGFVHAPWRTIAQYYIAQYKTGVAPAITTDRVVFWYRSHPKAATCSAGTLPRNADYPADAVFGFAMLASAATVTLDIGSKHYQWDAPAGVSIGSVPFPTEDAQIPFIQILRGGVQVKSGYGSAYVTNSCDYYNFNPFVGVVQ